MFETSVYKNRRARLKEKVKSGLVLILGNGEAPANYTDNTYKFRQDSSFLYFFGLNQPGFAGVIDIDSGDEYLFGNDVDMDDIIWMGPQPSVKDMAGRGGGGGGRPLNRYGSPGRRVEDRSFCPAGGLYENGDFSGTPDSFFTSLSFQEYALARRVVGYPACFGEKLCFAGTDQSCGRSPLGKRTL